MDLPSFIWLWRIAAWSMGLSLMIYSFLAISGGTLLYLRKQADGKQADHCQTAGPSDRQNLHRPQWLRPMHYTLGGILVFLVLLLLSIGVVGTLGEFGQLGHSMHLPAGLTVVALTLASAWSATQISPQRPWARKVHLTLNGILLFAFVTVTATGWVVVQKYL
ncbi:MAG: DUF4079 domain-containing protein [Phormidesmis sp.]